MSSKSWGFPSYSPVPSALPLLGIDLASNWHRTGIELLFVFFSLRPQMRPKSFQEPSRWFQKWILCAIIFWHRLGSLIFHILVYLAHFSPILESKSLQNPFQEASKRHLGSHLIFDSFLIICLLMCWSIFDQFSILFYKLVVALRSSFKRCSLFASYSKNI